MQQSALAAKSPMIAFFTTAMPGEKVISLRLVACLVTAAVGGLLCAPAHAYNDTQHQGIVALGYKAMVAAALENGCASPIDFEGGTPPPSLRTFPGTQYCSSSDPACAASWQTFLGQIDRSIGFLRTVQSALPPYSPRPTCSSTPVTGNEPLGDISESVNPAYRNGSACGFDHQAIPPGLDCSSPARLCDPSSIYQFLAPGDHTGDVLGWHATSPDADLSVIAVGIKPTNSVVAGSAVIHLVNDILEIAAGVILAPFVCIYDLFSGDNCLDDVRSLADDAIPLEEIASLEPVIAPWHSSDYTGIWHFIQMRAASNECDDHQGMLYEEAGPRFVPDALDVGIMAVSDLAGITVSYDDSTGPKRFNITAPGDGDAPSCDRDAADWEWSALGHTVFSPLDNLALYGWRGFVSDRARGLPPEGRADWLGWPLHAAGDAVAPHHVTGTTGWGHRPFEDVADEKWREVLYQDVRPVSDMRRRQYEQLRRILGQAFHYRRRLLELTAGRPVGLTTRVPMRAFITEVAQQTFDETVGGGSFSTVFSGNLSVPYALNVGDLRDDSKQYYRNPAALDLYRRLLERGSAAATAMMIAFPIIDSQPPSPSAICGSAAAEFGADCSGSAECNGACCVARPGLCDEACRTECLNPGTLCQACSAGSVCDLASGCCGPPPPSCSVCSSNADCLGGEVCDPTGCCVPAPCSRPCTVSTDCGPGESCDFNCCGCPKSCSGLFGFLQCTLPDEFCASNSCCAPVVLF